MWNPWLEMRSSTFQWANPTWHSFSPQSLGRHLHIYSHSFDRPLGQLPPINDKHVARISDPGSSKHATACAASHQQHLKQRLKRQQELDQKHSCEPPRASVTSTTRHSYSVTPSVRAVVRCFKGLLPFSGSFHWHLNVPHPSLLTITLVVLMCHIYLGAIWATLTYRNVM